MEIKVILHTEETTKDVVERLVKENLEHKVSAILRNMKIKKMLKV